MQQQNTWRVLILRSLLSASLAAAGCAKSGGSGDGGGGGSKPNPQATKADKSQQTKDDKKETDQSQQGKGAGGAQNQSNTSGASRSGSSTVKPEDRMIANAPPPAASAPNSQSISRILTPNDDTMILFTRMLVSLHAEDIESARDRLVDEIFSDEGQAPLKILELQSAVARLVNGGFYTPESKARVAYLRSDLEERAKNDQYADTLKKGAIFVATSFLVLGPVAASGLYRQVPELGTALRRSVDSTKAMWRDNVTGKLGSKLQELRSGVTDPARRRAFYERTVNRGKQIKDSVAETATRAFRPTETLVRDNLEDLGVGIMQPEAINELVAVDSSEVPQELVFTPTPKASLEFAVVDRWAGEDLGINRRLVFRQQRLVRGVPLQTTFVSNPIAEDVASSIGEKISLRAPVTPISGPVPLTAPETVAAAAADQEFVHVVNAESGAVSATRMRWSQFTNMLKGIHGRYAPLFLSPTSLGVGVTSAAAMGGVYWWGFNDGAVKGQPSSTMDLEAMVGPRAVTPTSSAKPFNQTDIQLSKVRMP